MKRVLLLKDGVVQNVVGFDDAAEVPLEMDGCRCAIDPTGSTNAGDAFDERELTLDAMDRVVFRELFRLTNELRATRGLGALTATQYRAHLKTLL